MDDFRLRVFVTAAETLNFSRCAQQLGISQPAVSNHIKELEAAYGVKLFARKVSGICLTPIGRILLARAEEILSRYAGVACEMRVASSAQKMRELRIIASENFSRYVLPEVVARFMQLAPWVNVTIRTATNAEVENFLEMGAADLGFVEKTDSEYDWHYEYEKLAEDEVVLVAGRENCMDWGRPLSVEELKQQALVMSKHDVDLIEDVNSVLDAGGLSLHKLNVVMWLESTEAVKRIVAHGDMMALVSYASVKRKLASGKLRRVEIEDFKVSRDFAAVAVKGQMDDARKAFCSLVRGMISEGGIVR